MSGKLKTLDPVLIIGILVSVFSAFILVVLGKDEINSLIVGLLITVITLGIDIIGRVKETQSNMLQAIKLGKLLDVNSELHETILEITDLYLSSQVIGFELFRQRSKDALLECKDILSGIQRGYIQVEVAGKYSYGKRGAEAAKSTMKAIAYEDVDSWRTEHLKGVMKANSEAAQRGVSIERIFILKKDNITVSQDVLESQNNAGVGVWVVAPEDLPKTELLESFLLIDDKVLVVFYYTRDGSKFRSEKISIDPVEVDRYVDMYNLIKRRSQKFEFTSDKRNK
jgi:hypothetical protein